jgi:LuxR family maltose regulon positive regulatory protein
MLEGLIATKLHIPRPRPGVISRERLDERLVEGASRILTLVSAPAGFGKTTAVSDWIHRGSQKVGWVSLNRADNDPGRFWSYVLGALQTVQAGLGGPAASLLTSPQQPAPESFLTVLVNEAADVDGRFGVILEDYHVIDNEAIHEGLTFLLEHLPEQMHVVIVTRADPPLPLVRLRARDELTEIRADDLRFTEEEVARYLRETVTLEIDAAGITALESRTEGWVAGLQMAALSMQDRDDLEGFIESLKGTHRFILDYLAEEVLARQTAETKEFLLKTSILGSLTGSLCDAVTGRQDSREVLERLESCNLFVMPLDDERRWYRYHHLFSEFLRSYLEDSQSDDVADLHKRASRWFAHNDLPADAIEHSMAVGDFETVADLLEEHGERSLWRDSQNKTLLSWLDSLPGEVVSARPQVALLHAWTRCITGQWDSVEPLLQSANDLAGSLPDRERDRIIGEIAAIRSGVAYEIGEMDRGVELAQKAVDLLPKESGTVRAVAAVNLGLGLSSTDQQAADEAWAEAEAIGDEFGNVTISLLATGLRVELCVRLGDLNGAAEHYERACSLGSLSGSVRLPPAGLASVYMGEVLRQRNDLVGARRALEEGIELSRQQGGMPEHVLTGFTILARVLLAMGRDEASKEAMESANAIIAEFEARPGEEAGIISQALANRARWQLARGDAESVQRYLASTADDADKFVRVRCMMMRGDFDESLRALDQFTVDAEATGHIVEVIEGLVLQSMAQQELGRETDAVEAIDRALAIAEEQGYMSLFLEEGEPMRYLLSKASGRYSGRILAQFGEAVSRNSVDMGALNEREIEILRLIAAGLSNNDIGNELFISLNTVKWHARNVYGKLGVKSRSAAVARARELSLI